MSPLRFLLLAAVASLAVRAPSAQTVQEVAARHRDGQTFLTWRELAGTGNRYRIYRSEKALKSASDLAGADFLGEVNDRTSRNQGRSLATGVEHAWVIVPGGPELDVDQGLFVHTVAERAERRGFYAVTVVAGGSETRTLVPGANATTRPVLERAAPPQPVLQFESADGELYGHWVSDRDTPFQPALAPWPSSPFDFLLQRGTAVGPHGLVLRLHASGQTYAQAWPQRFETPRDVDSLALNDLVPYAGHTFWFGSQENLPGAADAQTEIWNYTQERALWTLDWVIARLGTGFDPERLYLVGGSMGAIGGTYLLGRAPERFAAALLRNGLYDLEASDYRNPGAFEDVFGDFDLDLSTRDGVRILDRTNALFMTGRDLGADWPVLRTLGGRNDETVGWESYVGLMRGLAAQGRPAVHYFDERIHNPNGYWRDLERALLVRTFQVRRDRPALRFLDGSLDQDPGDGTRTDGDPVGTINGAYEYDPATAAAGAEALDFDVYLRDSGALDDAQVPRATAALMPWRTGAFALAPGEAVRYTLHAGQALVDEHLLFADAHGHVRTPPVPLDATHRHARFARGAALAPEPLFVGAAPIAGDALQVVVRGAPGDSWRLFVLVGDAQGPHPRGLLAARRGTFGADGLVDLSVPVPGSLGLGSWLWVRARRGAEWTRFRAVAVQEWTGVSPRPGPSR